MATNSEKKTIPIISIKQQKISYNYDTKQQFVVFKKYGKAIRL